MDYLVNHGPMRSTRETEVQSKGIGVYGRLDLNPESATLVQEFFNDKEPTGPSTLRKQLSLPARLKRSVRQRRITEATRMVENSVLP